MEGGGVAVARGSTGVGRERLSERPKLNDSEALHGTTECFLRSMIRLRGARLPGGDDLSKQALAAIFDHVLAEKHEGFMPLLVQHFLDVAAGRCHEQRPGLLFPSGEREHGDIMTWIMDSTFALCRRVARCFRSFAPDTYEKLQLVVELRGWRSYLRSITKHGGKLGAASRAREATLVALVQLSDLVDDALGMVESQLPTYGASGGLNHEHCSIHLILEGAQAYSQEQPRSSAGFTVQQISQEMLGMADLIKLMSREQYEALAVAVADAAAAAEGADAAAVAEAEAVQQYSQEQPRSYGGCTVQEMSAGFTVQETSAGFTVQETSRISLEAPPLRIADLKMPTLRTNSVAAGGSEVSPFHVEVFDFKAAVAALSEQPMAKLKMQAETKDEVFLLWKTGDNEDEAPPAAANICTHVLSAQLKGHDKNHRGQVDYQFFSPLIDFDLEEESGLQPGRHTAALALSPKSSANVLSIKVESGIGFPVSLYGSVLVRDALDDEGICLFLRGRDTPQLIKTKDETLHLIGPSRGLVVFDGLYFDIDLKVRLGDQQEDDLDFCQGTIEYNRIYSEPPLVSDKLSSEFGTLELNYAPVRGAIEATVEIQIVQDSVDFPASTKSEEEKNGFDGKLYGKISARCTSISEEIVLFDSDASGTMFTFGDDGVLELSRRALSVSARDSLVVTVETWGGGDDGEVSGLSRAATKLSFDFLPLLCGEGRVVVPCAGYTMQIKVVWAALYISKVDP